MNTKTVGYRIKRGIRRLGIWIMFIAFGVVLSLVLGLNMSSLPFTIQANHASCTNNVAAFDSHAATLLERNQGNANSSYTAFVYSPQQAGGAAAGLLLWRQNDGGLSNLLQQSYRAHPDEFAKVWGSDTTAALDSAAWTTDTFKPGSKMNGELVAFLSDGQFQRVQSGMVSDIINAAIRTAQANGQHSELVLALSADIQAESGAMAVQAAMAQSHIATIGDANAAFAALNRAVARPNADARAQNIVQSGWFTGANATLTTC